VGFFHRFKLVVVLAAVTELAGELAVDAAQKNVTVVAGDDYLFPSFQLGYLAASAIAGSGHRHQTGAATATERGLEVVLTRVTPETGVLGDDGGIVTVSRVIAADRIADVLGTPPHDEQRQQYQRAD
jgi:hypothetical protein